MGHATEDSSRKGPARITATLTQDQHEALVNLAEKNKVSIAWLVRQAIDRMIDEAEGGPRLPFTF